MNTKKRTVTNVRAVTIMILFLIFFSTLFGRMVYIQAAKEVNGQELQQIAKDRWTKQRVLDGKRGTIYDRHGGVLAQEISSYTMYAVLEKSQHSYVKDPKKTAAALEPFLTLSSEQIQQLLSSEGRFQVELGQSAKNMSYEQMMKIESLNLDGIFFREEPRRYYPKQTYASHVIGYTERDMEKSRMGLEKSLDDLLRENNGYVVYQSDRKGVQLPNPNKSVVPPNNGHDVFLTLDSNIQTALEQVMTKVEQDYNPERIIAIVADPKTGQILAMSNRPSFNPNHYEQITNYMNFAISDRFEPGSTMKMFTLAAALEEGAISMDEYFQSGTYRIGNRTISDHNQGRGWGMISYLEGMERSSNVAFSKIALEKLGTEKLYEYIERFGFSNTTGIDLPNEATGLIANRYTIDAATTAFGQATAITPIQQIQAATAIANGGKMMKPYVIDRIVNPDTDEVAFRNEPEMVGEPISESTAREMLDILESIVISSAGTGRPYQIEGFDVVGKTGTAQIPNPQGGGYLQGDGKNIFSFLGMAPKNDPRVVIYVAVDRPKLKPFEAGSAPVSLIFNTVMKHSLQYLNITPSFEEIKKEGEKGIVLKDYRGKSIEKVRNELESLGTQVVLLGDGGTIAKQYPESNQHVLEGEKVLLRTTEEVYAMPDITNWSLRDVMRLANLLDITPTIFGSGFVVEQSIPPLSAVKPGDSVVIELSGRKEENQNDIDENNDTEEEIIVYE